MKKQKTNIKVTNSKAVKKAAAQSNANAKVVTRMKAKRSNVGAWVAAILILIAGAVTIVMARILSPIVHIKPEFTKFGYKQKVDIDNDGKKEAVNVAPIYTKDGKSSTEAVRVYVDDLKFTIKIRDSKAINPDDSDRIMIIGWALADMNNDGTKELLLDSAVSNAHDDRLLDVNSTYYSANQYWQIFEFNGESAEHKLTIHYSEDITLNTQTKELTANYKIQTLESNVESHTDTYTVEF